VRIGVLLNGIYPPQQLRALALLIESLGFHTLWHGDDKFYRDPVANLTLCATYTQRLELGTAVLEPYTRHPALIATAMATVDELSQGRVMIGLGAGGSGFEAMGIERSRPVQRLREAILLMRKLWQGEWVEFSGETITFHGRLRFPLYRPVIPILIGTRGPQLYRLAGEIADGALISTVADPPAIYNAIGHIAAGAQQAGRSLADLRLICRLDACIAEDSSQAKRAVKPMLAASLKSSYPNWQFLQPLELSVPNPVREAIETRDRARLASVAQLLPNEFAERLALVGTASEVANRICQIQATGIDEIVIYPVPLPRQRIEEQLLAFASLLTSRQ
jgi:5,10-methylenetetrahydromethanopterin reductase